MSKAIKKTISITLFIILILQLLPIATIAASYQKEQARVAYLQNSLSEYLYDVVDTKGIIEVVEPSPYETLSENPEYELTLKNDNNETVAYVFSEPIAFYDDNGKLHYKDTNIVQQTDNEKIKAGYEYANGTNNYRINFSTDSSKGLKIHSKNTSWQLSPLYGTTKTVNGKVANEKIDNKNTALFVYEGAFGVGTKLKYFPQLNGCKEDIILTKYTGTNKFSFSLNIDNGYAVLNDDRTITILDSKTNETVDTFVPPFAYDSIKVEDGKSDALHYVDCEYELVKQSEGKYVLSVVVPENFLEAKTTVYPVVIDPTTSSIYQSVDTPVYSGYPTSSYSSNATNCFGRASGYNYGRVLTKFTIPSAIKSYATISSAYLWVRETTGRTTTTYVRPYMNTSAFSASTTWNTKPSYDPNTSMSNKNINSASTDGGPSAMWYKFDISYAVRKWTTGTANNGLTFISDAESSGEYYWRAFASVENSTSSYRPYAVITYTNDTVAPTVSVSGNPTSWTYGAFINVSATDNSSGVAAISWDNGATWQNGSSSSKTCTANTTYYVKAKDRAGNVSNAVTVNVTKIDRTAPTISGVSKSTSAWTNGNVTLTVAASDSQSGISQYSFDGGQTWQSGNSKTISSNGTYTIKVKDNVGYISSSSVTVSNIDKVAPTMSSVTKSTSSWTNSGVTLTATASDTGGSNIAYYSFDNGSTWQTGRTKTVTSNGTSYVKAKDAAGNISSAYTCTVTNCDSTSPGGTVSGNPTSWTTGDVTLAVNASDTGSGIASYSFDNGSTWQNGNTKTFTSNQTVYIKIKDNAGNITGLPDVEITKIDKTPPTISAVEKSVTNWTNSNVTLTVSATDTDSGIASYSFDGGSTWQNENTITVSENQSVIIKVKDNLGNTSDSVTEIIDNIDVTAPATPYIIKSGDTLKICCFDDVVLQAPEQMQYKLGENGTWTEYTNPISVVCTSDTTVYCRKTDEAGNTVSGSSEIVKANVGIYSTKKKDLNTGDFMLPSGFIRTFSATSPQWFFAFNSTVTEENSNIISLVDFYGITEMFAKKTNGSNVYCALDGSKITKDTGTITAGSASASYAYMYSFGAANVYYAADGKIAGVVSGNQTAVYTWTTGSLIISDNHSRTYTVAFTGDLPTSITDCMNNSVYYSWSTDNKLVSFTNAMNNSETYSYDSAGRLIANGNDTVVYTSDGRTAKITQPNGSFVKYSYDDTAVNSEDSSKPGAVTIFDSRGISTVAKFADGFVIGKQADKDSDNAVYNPDSISPTVNLGTITGNVAFVHNEDEIIVADEQPLFEESVNGLYAFYSYNGNGDIIASVMVEIGTDDIIPQTFAEAETIATQKTTYVYAGDNLTEQWEWIRVENMWGYDAKTIYVYDLAGTLISYSDYDFYDGDWQLQYSECYSFDAYGNVCETISTDNTGDTMVFKTVNKTYNSLGQLLEENHYTGTTLDFSSSYVYDAAGNVISNITDEKTVSYIYDNNTRLTSFTQNSETTTCTYSSTGNLVSVTHPTGVIAYYTYDSYGNLTGQSLNGYSFTYNSLGNILSAYAENSLLVSYTYSNSAAQNVTGANFGNGQSIIYTYNNGKLADIKLGTVTKYGYEYFETIDGNGEIANEWTELTDYVSDIKKKIETNKQTITDLDDNFIYSVERVTNGSYAQNSLYGTISTVGTDILAVMIEEDKDTFKTNGTTDFVREYTCQDDLLLATATASLTTTYTYNDNNRITSLENTMNGLSKVYGYVYTATDNIESETVSTKDVNGAVISSETTNYTYDSRGQLISAENSSIKYEYTYDNRGNILFAKKYSITVDGTGEKVYTLINGSTDTYVYDTVWQDKLVSFNGQSITYDNVGNPTNYLGNALTWTMGRQLASFGSNTYTYDENGIRTSKTVNGTTTSYYLDDANIIAQTDGTTTLYFRYDSDGDVVGFKYNDTDYIYIKNMLGDVVGITDLTGNLLVSYAYDPWGVVTSITGTNVSLGDLNPFRYRSYYYDSDTQMYYLRSRYYSPQIRRFINSDDVNYIRETVVTTSAVLFSYCENNPTSRYDISGMKSRNLIDFLLHFGNSVARAIGIDTAAIGAACLMMELVDGIYHARQDCWQQYFGYNSLYDVVFDIGTSMQKQIFEFSYNGSGYTFWAWKGDYINLGAGAELGIYRGASGHRTVDTSLAMSMFMLLFYKNEPIIGYAPDEAQWWITGFNPNYQNKYAEDLTAVFGVVFNDIGMYRAFKNEWNDIDLSQWVFIDIIRLAILVF